MKITVKNIFSNSSTRVLLLVFVAVLVIATYFTINTYYSQLNLYVNKTLAKTSAVAATLGNQIDGDMHQELMLGHLEKDAITTNEQDENYRLIRDQLMMVKQANKIETSIYTMVKDPKTGEIVYGVSSSDQPYFRHKYKQVPQELLDKFSEGGVVTDYVTENGHWLSAFAPIRNSKGEVVAVVQVDDHYQEFIEKTDQAIWKNIAISLVIVVLVAFFVVASVRTILAKEQRLTQELKDSHTLIEQRNKDITDSITYARRIQEAVTPSLSQLNSCLPDAFMLHIPRDIVSGDFFWIHEHRNKVILAAVDCTGHGVPGAFMSMIGNILLSTIVNREELLSPGEMLDLLDQKVTRSLCNVNHKGSTHDGMDIALVIVDKDQRELQFAGAFRPLLRCRDGEITETKGNRYSIGGDGKGKNGFTTHKLAIEEGDAFYIFSDGFADQFGGDRGKKYMISRFKKVLCESKDEKMPMLGEKLRELHYEWKGDNEQVDDILVIGFRM